LLLFFKKEDLSFALQFEFSRSEGIRKMREHHDVIVVGGSQAGLSVSHCLTGRGIDHVVFEANRIGHAWRTQRWDSFCLVTPNWQCRLPGFAYAGTDPDGFMPRDDIVAYIEAYAKSFAPPLREGVRVTAVRTTAGGFEVDTSEGDFSAASVVIAIGGYHVAKFPTLAARMPEHIVQIHSSAYKTPKQLPPGEILVVGTGQSGCQIAEDLHIAGRRVHLCTGSAPRVARRYRGRDVVAWLEDMGHYDLPVEKHPLGAGVRAKSNHYVTGRGGGRDIDLRVFALQGMQLYGRLLDIDGTRAVTAPDLIRNLDGADESFVKINASIDAYIEAQGIDAPAEATYTPPWSPEIEPTSLDLVEHNISAIVWSMGFRSDFSFIEAPIFDERGYPAHTRGVTPIDGLYFLGLPWLHSWGSGRFAGVGRDAEFLADRISTRVLQAA
jgi:putative flavoprotein involved in K+ transport